MKHHGIEPSASRRDVLQAIGTIAVGLSGDVTRLSPETSVPNDTKQHGKSKFDESTYQPMSDDNKVGYLAMPGVSLTSLVVNLPSLPVDGRQPIIVMDRYDYARFRSQVLTELENQKMQMLGMVYEHLRRRDMLHFIDYTTYYTPEIQSHLSKYRDAFAFRPEHKNREATETAAEGYLTYGLGGYQGSYRSSLNDSEAFANRRQQVEHQRKKVQRGTEDPVLWNDRVISQYQTALEVRQRVENDLSFAVPYIIGQGESSLINIALNEDIDHDFITDFEGSKSENPITRILEVDTEKTAQTREIIDEITTAAREISSVEENDFFIFGPRLAIPQFPQLYNQALGKMSAKEDLWGYVKETQEVRAYLHKESADGRSVQSLQAATDRIAEDHSISSEQDKERLFDQIDKAYELSNHSRDIKALNEGRHFSSPAILIAASIEMDPVRCYNENEIHQQAVDLQRRFEQVTASEAQIERFAHRGGFRREGSENADWYQRIDRQR